VGSYGGGINQHDGKGIYGFNWWFNKCLTTPPRDPPLLAWPSAPADTYIAMGHFGKEGMAVFPSLGMVVAAYNPNIAAWGDTVITDPPNPNSTMNQNLKLLAEPVPLSPPTIITQPRGLAVNPGSNATFSVSAYGAPPLFYKWSFNGTNIAGATNSTYTRTNAQLADAGTYAVFITNQLGSVTSSNAVLTINTGPSILTQPQSQAVIAGRAVHRVCVWRSTSQLSMAFHGD